MTSEHQKDPKVVEMVRNQLTRRRTPPNVKALYGRAVRINEEIRELSLRQFNALYPLQVRRKLKREAREAARRDREEAEASTAEPSPGRGNGSRAQGSRKAEVRDEGSSGQLRRSAVRSELFAFAAAVAGAAGQDELIDVILDLDRWVDRVEEAAARTGS